MKPVPPFNEEESREEAVAFILIQYKDWNKPYYEVQEKDLPYLEQLIDQKRRYWPDKWENGQIWKGEEIINNFMNTLSKDDKELVEDYLDDIRNRAETKGYESGYEFARNQ